MSAGVVVILIVVSIVCIPHFYASMKACFNNLKPILYAPSLSAVSNRLVSRYPQEKKIGIIVLCS